MDAEVAHTIADASIFGAIAVACHAMLCCAVHPVTVYSNLEPAQ